MKRAWIIALPIAALLACSGCSDDRDLPQQYRKLEVPSARLASAEARQRGRDLFLEHCALCHGVHADGRGERREGLVPPPRDFTSVAWRRGTSPRRVFFVIREGVRGTAMPAWRTLDDDQTWDLVAYVLSVSGETP